MGAIFIIKFDGDGQHLESDIPQLLQLLKNNKFDFVKGNRFIGSYSDMPMIRVFANLITTNLQRLLLEIIKYPIQTMVWLDSIQLY